MLIINICNFLHKKKLSFVDTVLYLKYWDKFVHTFYYLNKKNMKKDKC